MRLALLILALPLLAAAPAPIPLTITLAGYRFEPAMIRLRHGQSYVLRLANPSGHGHDFTAPAFLAAAGVARGSVEVPAGTTTDVAIVAPAPGRYKVKCSHFTHAMRGMTAEVVVE